MHSFIFTEQLFCEDGVIIAYSRIRRFAAFDALADVQCEHCEGPAAKDRPAP
jgi:hypothetical protein